MPTFNTDATLANGGESTRENTDTPVNDTSWRTWVDNPLSPDEFFYLREPNRAAGAGGNKNPTPNGGGTGATAGGKNPLHKFASYSWMWSLCCLSKGQTNFPDSIKGQFKAGIPVAVDMGASDYHFDSMRIQGIAAPNAHIRNTHSISFDFDIFEPYSLGNFIEDLDKAARAQGWANYSDAGWMLGLKFDGWDDQGRPGTVGPFNFVVKLINAKFKYTEGGTMYQCQAIAWNDQAWNDENATLKTNGTLVGDKLKDICFYGQNSLTALLNSQELKKQEKGLIAEGDQYYIVFPDTKTSAEEEEVLSALSSPGAAEFAVEWLEDWDKERGIGSLAAAENSTGDAQAYKAFDDWVAQNKIYNLSGNKGTNSRGPVIYNFYKDNCNKIGESTLSKTPFDRKINKMNPVRNTKTDENYYIFQNRFNLLDHDSFSIKCETGNRIIDILEELILASEYGRNEGVNGKPDENNKVNWYKIQCFVLAESSAKEPESGRTAKTYIYRVIEHKAALNRFAAPGSIGKGGGSPARIYNYIYTGLNNDVLKLDLDFNYSFFAPITSDMGHNEATAALGTPGLQHPKGPDVLMKSVIGSPPSSPDEITQTQSLPQRSKMTIGTPKHTESIANRDWHNILMNSDVDLLNIEMDIHGDPVYLQSNGCGNYIAGSDGNLTKDGDLEYINSEADIQINFETPYDLGVPWTTPGQYRFTGFYQVVKVQSTFTKSEGFKQTLSCIRYRQQGEGTSTPMYEPGGELISDVKEYRE
jgi:hypothetical protein